MAKVPIPPEHWDGVFAPSSFLSMETTVSTDGRINAAPHATCVRVCHDPVHIAVTLNSFSHTAENIAATGEFVVNQVPFEPEMLRKVRVAGLPFDEHTNELERVGLTSIDSEVVAPPRIKEFPVHFECRLLWKQEWVHRTMVVGEVVAASIDEECYDPKGYIYWDKVRPAVFAGVPYDGNFLPAYEPTYVPLEYDGPKNWRSDLQQRLKETGVDWSGSAGDLAHGNVLEEQADRGA